MRFCTSQHRNQRSAIVGRRAVTRMGWQTSLALVAWTFLPACAPGQGASPNTVAPAPPVGPSTIVSTPVAAPAPVGASVAPTMQPAVASAPQGGSISVGLNTQLGTLDPLRMTSTWEFNIAQQIYDYLVAVDSKEPRISPWLANSWTVSSDLKTYTFKLKPGVKFHDGTAFDAGAARKNFERLSAGAASGAVRDLATNLAGVTAQDDSTLVVDLKSSSPGFMSELAYVPMLSPGAWEQWGDDYGQHPVGTGPFKVKEWIAQDHLVLERNDEYAWAPANSSNTGRAYLDSVTFKFIVDPPARLVSLESGDTQMVTFVPLQDAQRISADQRFKVVQGASSGIPLTFFMNVSVGPLADRQVRAAVQSALDRSELIQSGGHGMPIPAAGLLTSTTRCFSSGFANIFRHDLAGASQLLDDAGWLPGPGGIRQKDGAPLAFDLVYFPDYVDLAATIQAQLREAGIQLNLKMLDLPAGNAMMRNGQASTFLVAGVANDPGVLSNVFHSRAVGSASVSAANAHDPDIDKLLDRAAAEADSSTQCQLYDEFQQRYLQTAAAFPVWEITAPVAMRSNIDGVRLVPNTGSMPLFQEIFIRR